VQNHALFVAFSDAGEALRVIQTRHGQAYRWRRQARSGCPLLRRCAAP
jgi:hypothetical protein